MPWVQLLALFQSEEALPVHVVCAISVWQFSKSKKQTSCKRFVVCKFFFMLFLLCIVVLTLCFLVFFVVKLWAVTKG